MLRSMTGFSRASLKSKNGLFVIELNSVNRRFFESNIFLPKEFVSLEAEIRKELCKNINRGQLTFRLFFYPSKSAIEVLPDSNVIKELKKNWEHLADDLKLDKKKIDLSFLARELKNFPSVEKFRDISSDKKIIFQILSQALDSLNNMKEKEGSTLSKDMKKRLKLIEKELSTIELLTKETPREYEEKLKERLSQFLSQNQVHDERVLKEVAIFAERVDISEEITRLKSHINQFYNLLKETEVGRKLDFLLQEMSREANTISAKSLSKNISIHVVNIKSELEKIREQVQNIE